MSAQGTQQLLDGILGLASGRLAVTRMRPLEGSCLLPRPERRAIPGEPDDHEDREYEGVVEDQVVPAVEEEQQVEAVDREARSEDGIPGSPGHGLAGLDARHDEHRDATEDEEQYIDVEHVDTSPFVQASRAWEGKMFDHPAIETWIGPVRPRPPANPTARSRHSILK